jgi:Tfp pilus assembly protein PilV
MQHRQPSSPANDIRRSSSRGNREAREAREAGDTLIEVLIAIVVISIGMVALIGALTTSVTSSATYRSLATIDTVLKNFAEAVKYEVDLQPDSSSIYLNCATNYQLATEYPTSATVGSGVTVLGTDFVAQNQASVTVDPALSSVPAQNFLSGQTVGTDGNVAATFDLPPTPAGSWPIVLSDTQSSVVTTTNLTVTPSVGSESPQSGPIGTSVTISVDGFLASTPLTVMVNGVIAAVSSGGTTGTNGSATVVFAVPPTSTGSQTVVVSDGTYSANSTFGVGVPSGTSVTAIRPPVSALAGYHVGIASVAWWNDSTQQFDSSPTACTPDDSSGIQMITLTATAPNNVSDTLSTIVTDPDDLPPLPGPTIAVTPSTTTPTFGNQIQFSTVLTGSNGGPAPSGTIAWTFSGSPGIPPQPCGTSTLQPGSGNATTPLTCTIPSAQVGLYQVAATYSGDSNYSPSSGYSSVTVPKLASTVTVTPSTSTPTIGQPLSFSATISGGSSQPTPAGSVSWTFTPTSPGTPPPVCSPSNVSGSGNSATTLTPCLVSPAQQGTYQVSASYSGDANYLPQSGNSNDVVVTPLTVTNVVLANGGSKPGQIESGDRIAITFSAQMSVSSICSTWTGDTTNQTIADGLVTFTDNSPSGDRLLFSSGTCNLNIGTFNLGSSNYVKAGTGSASFSGSMIGWNATSMTLTVTLGTPGGSGVLQTVGSSAPTYFASSSMSDTWGYSITNSPFSIPSATQF